jgi:hypothetical protein
MTWCVVCCVGALVFFFTEDAYNLWSDNGDDADVPLQIAVTASDDGNADKDTLERQSVNENESSVIWDGIHMDKLMAIRGDTRMNGHKVTTAVLTSFHPGLNVTYRRLMRSLIGYFIDGAKQHNVTYFLYSGSLMGSYRHHGMIPWDDDFDVAVYIKDQPKLKTMVETLPMHIECLMKGPRWKMFYGNISKINNNIHWSFPFLDISFFRVIPRFVVDSDPGWANRFRYNISDVFPLVIRPFWDMWIPAPRNTRAVIETTYNISKCISNYYSHAKEKLTKATYRLSCQTMNEFYPHVKITKSNTSGVVEELVFNGSVVHSIKIATT